MNRFISVLKYFGLVAAFIFLVGVTVSQVFAQEETGQISGTVTDPTGAVLSNAKITVTSTATGATRTTTSSGAGLYAVTNLTPGTYEVTVEAQGFQQYRRRVDVIVGSRATMDARLSVGAAGTVVEVNEVAGAEVDTQTQTLGATITPTEIMDLPSLTRNIYDFAAGAGNVSDGDKSGMRGAGGLAINGQRSASTNILLDGAENVDLYTAAVGQQVPLDSVQEYKIETSNFMAASGRASGGIVNVTTKSGTNTLHGSAYEYNRVSALSSQPYNTDAINWSAAHGGPFSKVPNSPFTRNQFGFALGGPIKKNKLFFFTNTEWTRIRSNANLQYEVFDPAFVGSGGPTNANTQAFFGTYGALDKGTKVLGTLFTAGQLCAGAAPGWGNACAGSPNFSNYASSNPNAPVLDLVNVTVPTDAGAGNPSNEYNSLSRVDVNLTDKTSLWGRYAIDNITNFPGVVGYSAYAGYNSGEQIRNQNVLINLSHLFSANLVNQLKLSYNRLSDLQPLAQKPVSPSMYMSSAPPTPDQTHAVMMPGYLPLSQANSIPFGGPQNVYEVTDQVSWVHGVHNFAFGGTYIQARDNRVFGAYEEAINDVGHHASDILDNLMNGTMYSAQVAIYPQGLFPCSVDITTDQYNNPASCTIGLPATAPRFNRNFKYNDGSLYAQDSWKATHRLTLNLGLRWEYYGVQHNSDPKLDSNFYFGGNGTVTAANIRAGSVIPTHSSPVGAFWEKQPHDFGPRVGFAYDVFGNGKTALRGGYGMSYERNFGNVTFNVIQNPPNYAVVQLAGGFPISTTNLGPFAAPSGAATLPAVTLRAVNPHIKSSYANMYSLAIEQQIVPNTVFSIEYSGSRGLHQYSITNINRYYSGPTYSQDAQWDPTFAPYHSTCLQTDPSGASCFGSFENTRTNNSYGNINFRGSDGDSWYNGVNFGLRANNLASKGLSFTLNYTWSHSLDDLSSTFAETNATAGNTLGYLDWTRPSLDKASSDFDVRSRVAFQGVYTPPTHFQSRALDWIAGGWSMAPQWVWHKGTPFTMYDCQNGFTLCPRQLNGAQGTYTKVAEPDALNQPNSFNFLTPAPYIPYFATVNGMTVGCSTVGSIGPPSCDAASNLAGGGFGIGDVPSCTGAPGSYSCAFPSNMARRNTFRVPNIYTLNLGVYKTFKLTERVNLKFRAESYNLFNHSNYYLNYATTDSEFGTNVTANKGLPPGFAPERRNMQFALRVEF